MGYPVSELAPRAKVDGRTIAVDAFAWDNIIGRFFVVGVFEQSASGEWLQISQVANYASLDELLAAIKQKGGGVEFLKWLVALINESLAKLFGKSQPVNPSKEPATADEAAQYVSLALRGMRLDVSSNGVTLVNK